MILSTTSRRPTGRIRTFCRDLGRSISNIVRINRGKLSLYGIAERASKFHADRVIIVDRWRGGLGRIELFRTGPQGSISVSPLRACVWEIEKMKSHIIVNLDLPSEDRLKIVLGALEPETKTSTSTRSKVKVQAKGSTLRLSIEATDTSALRAAVNSYLRWIGLIINLCSVLDLLSMHV